jgi:hypothetical protein
MKFFLLAFSVSKSIGNIIFFYYQRTYRRTKNYWRKIHRRRLSVGDFIGNFFTNGMVVQMPMKNSIDKSKDFGSVLPDVYCLKSIKVSLEDPYNHFSSWDFTYQTKGLISIGNKIKTCFVTLNSSHLFNY